MTMMPDVKKKRKIQENCYGIRYHNIQNMIKENDDRIFCAIADGESWRELHHPEGVGYTTLACAVLWERRVDLLKLIIERHAAEKASIFSWSVHKDFLYIEGNAWTMFSRLTWYHCGLSTEEQEDVEYQMFSVMFECGGCPIEELVEMPWGAGFTVENKIHQRLVCELGKRRASWAIAWWSKEVGEAWIDIVEPLNNIFDAATFEDYWNN